MLCHENIKEAQQYLPEFLDDIIKKNLECIKFFQTPENQMPLFNGTSENSLDNFEKYLESVKISKKEKKHVIGNIFFAKSKSQVFYFDIGEPPSKTFSKNYQSGPLSFEYYLDGCLLYTSPSPRDSCASRMPSSA